MQKDVIYIDVEDDVTSIIGKIKASDSNIVALVPPKRIGAIQSIVNLKLVHRAAERVDKRLVIITNNDALSALAGNVGIPVAKNLQSRPEMAEIPALEVNSDDDVIDGAEATGVVGQPKTKTPDGDTAKSDDTNIDDADISSGELSAADPIVAAEAADAADLTKTPAKAPVKNASTKTPKIPDFNAFRKKLLIVLAVAILLIGGSIWAFVIAPRANVIIKAQMTNVAVNTQIKANASSATSLQDGTLKLTTKTDEKSISKTVTATGTKDVGEKATGSVRLSPTVDTLVNVISNDVTVPAGTTITSESGATYTTDASVTFSYSNMKSTKNGQTVAVTATANGTKYNGASGSADGPSGFTTKFVQPTSGGTDKTVKVIQQSDIDSAMSGLISDSDKSQYQTQLKTEFGSSYTVINETFSVDESNLSKPTANTQADSATITGTVKFSLSAIAKSELDTFLKAYCQQSIDGKSNQKIYKTGSDSASLTSISVSNGTVSATLSANGKVGPSIDETAVKEYVKGQTIGNVQERVKTIDGVKSVDVKLSPFWVYKVPGDTKKITITFEVDD